MENALTLTNGAVSLLHAVLSSPNAITDVKGKFAAGELLCGPLDGLPKVPEKNAEAWHKAPWGQLVLKPSQLEVARKALSTCIEQGAIVCGPPSFELMKALGLGE